jgi:YVTN family beta-propeller protein
MWVIGGLLGYALLALALVASRNAAASGGLAPTTAPGIAAFDTPTTSSPIALSADKNHIWVVNPDDDSVSVLGNLDATPSVIATIRVGDEPQAVALDAGVGAYHAYVVNAADNSVTIINVASSSPSAVNASVEKTIITGAEPWNVVASPDGRRVFVANSVQDTITVINAETRSVIGDVDVRNSACNDPDRSRHFQPRGLAVTLNNDRLFVTRFLSFTGGPAAKQGTDDGKVGVVCQLNINTVSTSIAGYTVAGAIQLAPQVTGFTVPPPSGAETKAYPNQLQSIVVRGNQAYLPNIAASTTGPLRFNLDTHAFVNVIDNAATGTPADASATKFLNLHLGARTPEAGKTRLFFANPWAIAFTTQSGAGSAYVVSAGSDLLVKVNVAADGKLDFTGGAATTRYVDLNGEEAANSGANAGKNPLGIVIRNNRAFTMNYVSRNLSVVDLATDSVTQVIKLTNLPNAGSLDEVSQVGKEIFFAARGVFNRPDGTTVSTRDRLSSEGWQNCASCHFNGWTDGNVWVFGAGPRKSVPLNGTFSPHNPNDQRVLNYSAIFDEVQDFEANIRNVSGPGPLAAPQNGSVLDPNHGLLISDTGQINFAPAVLNAFGLPNTGRQQLSVTLPGSNEAVPALDALNEWVRRAIRTPNGALTSQEVSGGLPINDVRDGRKLFFQAGCQACHGGTKWSNSTRDFTPPPAAAEISTETNPPPAAGTNPIGAQYLNRFLRDIKSFDLGVAGGSNPIGANVGAVEKASGGADGLGRDYNGDGKGIGFNVPSLLGIYNLPPYYHNGACETIACVLSNANHRTSGLKPGKADPLASASNRAKLELWLQTLDADTEFPTNLRVREHGIFLDPTTPFANTQVTVGVNVELFGTVADLTDLAGGAPIKVRFVAPGLNTEVDLAPTDFTQDFGTARVTTTWNVPADTGRKTIVVTIDSGDVLNDDEDDNVASRRVRVREQPADRTAPLVTEVTISDDNPFNANDQIANSANVKVRFKASDPPSSGGAQTSGLDAFCIVRYSFNTSERRWDEEKCNFQNLPAADAGTSDTFTVDAVLPPRKGTAYAFVWVRDKAGNIVSKPGFDFISIVPGPTEDVELDRNDTLIIRLRLNAGQSATFTLTPSSGDVDIAAFNADRQRVAVSANNGTAPETISVTSAANNSLFQIEIKAVDLSVFRITTTQGAIVELADAVNTIGARKVVANEPLTSGPPPEQTAIGEVYEVYLPIVTR